MLHLRRRLLQRDARLEPADAAQPARAALRGGRRESERHPRVGRAVEDLERRRHDADDRRALAVDERGLADDVGAAAEAALPQRVAQDDRGLGAAQILGRCVEPAEQRLHAERLNAVDEMRWPDRRSAAKPLVSSVRLTCRPKS